jgi:ankyrin repeat protein
MVPSPPAAANQVVLSTASKKGEKAPSRPDLPGATYRQPCTEDNNSVVELRRHRNTELLLPRDGKFDKILQEISEAPSECSLKNFLSKDDIWSSGSSLQHYVAARGRLDTMLLEVMHFSAHHGYTIDTLDKNGFTALHIAVQYDRIENVKTLVLAGAQLDIPNPYGELPLHVAIISSKDPGMVSELLFRHREGMDVQILGPSKRAGQTALDLVVERALREVSPSGDAVFTPNANRILSDVLSQSTGALENTKFLENHARNNYTRLLRAAIAIKHLSPLGAQRLVFTMRYFLRLEWRRRGASYSYDTYFNDLLSTAPQGASPTVSKTGPSMPLCRQTLSNINRE